MGFQGPTDDRLAIHELVMSYGDAVTRKDAEDWGMTWAEQATWRVPAFPGLELTEGREAIVANWCAAMEGFKQIVFTATLGALSVDGDRASGRTFTLELGTDLDDNQTLTAGRYDDEYIKQDGRWYFLNRTFTNLHSA